MAYQNPIAAMIAAAFRTKGTAEHTQKGPTRAAETRNVLNAMLRLGNNLRPDLVKYAATTADVATLEPSLMCIGTRIYVGQPDEGAPPAYLVEFDDAGLLLVHADANFEGADTPASLEGLTVEGLTEAEAVAAVLAASGRGLNPLVLPQFVEETKWYVWPTGIWEARGDFNAAAAPVAGPNWRLVVAFSSYTDQMARDANAPLAIRVTALEMTVRPLPAIYAVNLAKQVYQGTSLAAAISHAGGYGKIVLNQQAVLDANCTLGAGTQLDCQYNQLDLGGFTLTLSANTRLINCVGQNGRVATNHGVNSANAPTIVGGYCGYTFQLPASTFMVADSVLVSDFGTGTAGTRWTSGPGTLTLRGSFYVAAENTRLRDDATNLRDYTATAGSPPQDSITEAQLAPAVRTKLNATGAGGGGGESNQPDYVNPVTLNAAAALEVRKSYYLTGAGYTVTLPAGTNGQEIGVEVASSATGLFDVGGLQLLWAGERILLRYGPAGWKVTNRALRGMAIQRKNNASIPFGVEGNIDIPTPGVVTDNTNGLLQQRANDILIRRDGYYTINTQVFMNGTPAGALYEVKAYAAGSVYKKYAVISFNSAIGGDSLTMFLPAGAVVSLGVYYYNPAGTSAGQTIPNECFLSITEQV